MEKRFRAYLQHRGVSQNAFCSMSGVLPSTLSRFMQGKPIKTDQLLRILSACPDLSLDYLFRGNGEMFCRAQNDDIKNSTVKDDSVLVQGTSGYVNIHLSPKSDKHKSMTLYELISERDRSITERDRVIAENYQVIREKDDLIKRLLSGGAPVKDQA